MIRPPVSFVKLSQCPSPGPFLKLTHAPSAPKAKRLKQDVGVVKQLFQLQQEDAGLSHSDDITPPSSPEHYETANNPRYENQLLLYYFEYVWFA